MSFNDSDSIKARLFIDIIAFCCLLVAELNRNSKMSCIDEPSCWSMTCSSLNTKSFIIVCRKAILRNESSTMAKLSEISFCLLIFCEMLGSSFFMTLISLISASSSCDERTTFSSNILTRCASSASCSIPELIICMSMLSAISRIFFPASFFLPPASCSLFPLSASSASFRSSLISSAACSSLLILNGDSRPSFLSIIESRRF